MSQSKKSTEEEVRAVMEEAGIDVDAEIRYREIHAARYEQVKARRKLTRRTDVVAIARAEVSKS
jgi:hypothetical protein